MWGEEGRGEDSGRLKHGTQIPPCPYSSGSELGDQWLQLDASILLFQLLLHHLCTLVVCRGEEGQGGGCGIQVEKGVWQYGGSEVMYR